MKKGIGFDRNILLPWLDAAAALVCEVHDPLEVRHRLDSALAPEIKGTDARRKTIDLLLGIWLKSSASVPDLHARALELFRANAQPAERLWLHYGLALLSYPFFRQCMLAIGQAARQGLPITTAQLKRRLVASYGELGALKRSVERIVSSLHSWGLLQRSAQRFAYTIAAHSQHTEDRALERWLLACALHAHPAAELPVADLLALPELYPFCLTTALDDLRQDELFLVQRQGGEWDAVRLGA